MTAPVVQWPKRLQARAGWTNDELAELYRVENALAQASFPVETDLGLSDEGDPWFAFCHPDGQVVVHIARIDGVYHLSCVTFPHRLTGPSFSALTRAYLSTIPKPPTVQRSDGVVAHPSALLSLLVAAALFSVDAFVQHSAHAADLPATSHAHSMFKEQVHPGPAKETVVRAFAAAFKAGAGRGRSSDDAETKIAWQALEQAALAFSAFYGTDLRAETSGTAAFVPERPLVEATIQIDGPRGGDHVWSDSAGDDDERASGRTAVGGELAASAERTTPMPTYAQLPLFVGGEAAGVTPWRPVSFSGSGKITGSAAPTLSESADLTPNSSGGRELDIVLNGDESLELVRANGLLTVVVSGQGSLALFHAEALGSIAFMSGAVADVAPFYDPTGSSGVVPLALTLGGGTDISIVDESSVAPPVSIVVDSQGGHSNHLAISGPPHSPPTIFSLKIIGEEDLTLRESAKTFAASELDASEFGGALKVNVENLQNDATVDLSVDFSSATFGFHRSGSSAAEPLTLALDLGASSECPAESQAPVCIGLINANGVDNLSIASSGGANSVQTIVDDALTDLQLTGSGALEIDAILGVKAADGQSVVIDASGLAGFLTLNANGIADLAAGGRAISIVLGAGGGEVTDTTASEALTVTMGSGRGFLNLGDGATLVTIVNLKSADHVNVGDATVVDTFVNGLALSSSQQTSIDASVNLLAAATTAATAAGAAAAHQAVLFSYKGDSYVFVDAAGNHVFDPSLDAIVKLTGVVPTTDLAGVFHSAP